MHARLNIQEQGKNRQYNGEKSHCAPKIRFSPVNANFSAIKLRTLGYARMDSQEYACLFV